VDTAGKIMIPISLVNNICRRQNLGTAMKTLYDCTISPIAPEAWGTMNNLIESVSSI